MNLLQWKQRARRTARAIRHTPDRLLHPFRRRQAQRLHLNRDPESVLFVCYGNICRSPYAAAIYERLVGGRGSIRVGSAGFIGPGRASPPEAQSVAERRGLDLRAHRSQLLSAELLGRYELVVVMERSQAAALVRDFGRASGVLVLGDLDPGSIDTRTILDPYGQAEEVFEIVYDRIDRCMRSLCRS